MSKKLIFCFDGTCNEPSDSGDFFEDASISNILKLHIFFGGDLDNSKNDKLASQRSFYYSGVGTRGNILQKLFNSMFAPRDADVKDILKEAKDDLKKHFQAGDEIYVFGFSRGAAIARMFAAEIADKTIHFLGVFDTVAAINGVDLNSATYPASGILFENGSLGGHIQKAVHCVSIDEKRLAFQPTLMNKREGILEVWFAGIHSDIGGGYWFDGLSDIALDFMLKQVGTSLKTLRLSEINFSKLKDKDGAICPDDLEIHPLFKGVLHKQERSAIIAKKTFAPRAVRVNVNDKKSKEDLPLVHYTARKRFQKVTGYRPYALRDVKYKVLKENGEVSSECYGICDLREESQK
jgi:pimeloyl-ACP methyl ester carboxylesterase